MTAPSGAGLPKYLRVAAAIRQQIEDGTLRPGQPAPSGAELSRDFGFSTLTCRKALRRLIADGLLVPGPSPNARPRVADPQAPELERDVAEAARALSAGLAEHRHAAGLTQSELAAQAGVSVTTIGHAETGRTWQSRRFWERADAALQAAGDLLRLHDVFRAASSPAHPGAASGAAWPDPATPLWSHARIGPAVAAAIGWPDLESAVEIASATSVPNPASWPDSGPRPFAASPADLDSPPAASVRTDPGLPASARACPAAASPPVPRGPSPVGPSRIIIVWTDGTITTVHAPEVLTRPQDPTHRNLGG
jgi:DNA-binding transcriptional regulator YhcF (GntR family)